MKLTYLLALPVLLWSCSTKKPETYILKNADNSINVEFNLTHKKTPFYTVSHNNKKVIDTSSLGLLREDSNFFNNLEILSVSDPVEVVDQYEMLHGKQRQIAYKANQYLIKLKNENQEEMDIVFNLSDDGVAFRYVFPEQTSELKKITEEKTTYNFIKNTASWLQPMSKAKTGWKETNPSYEEHYSMNIPVNTTPEIGEGWIYPALFKADSTWILVSETGLKNNYCGTRLMYNSSEQALQVTFPQPEETYPNGALKPESKLPWETPWRILAIGDLKTINESTLGTDLAEPAITMDTSFIKPGLASWSWVLLKDDFTNYETSKKFIDYASDMDWPYCLIDADWDFKIGDEKMKELADYAATKNVKILVWYNSSGDWNSTTYSPKSKLLTPEDRDTQFKKLNAIGVAGIKVDFFGGDGQSMIAYYHEILNAAAKHKLLVNFHGATIPRGWQRTYPNLMTVEAIKGEEFITFDQNIADLQPSHCAMLPFTRNVYDPMDFTPMVLDSIPNIKRKTTPAFELALPVLFLSGVQHIAEIPEGMAKQPKFVVDYLKDIPTDWDTSKFLSGYPGKDAVIARKKGNTWFIAGINGENSPKEITLDLSFTDNHKGFLITDGEHGFEKEDLNLKSNSTTKTIHLKPHGGFVMKF